MSVARFERGILKRYILTTSTKDRHRAKLLSLLDWIWRWGFTSTAVLEELWQLDRSTINRMVRRYINEGMVAEVATFSCRDKRLFLLKPDGLRMLNSFHNENLNYSVKPSTLNFKTITHDLMCQALVAKGCAEERYQFYVTESEQAREYSKKTRRCDAIVFETESAELVGVEVEASAKSIPHRKECLIATQRMIKEECRFSRVLYYSHKRKHLKDAERVHKKIFDKPENGLDAQWFNTHLKIVYSREYIDMLYHKFWQH
jgi:fructose-specific phosphotransferase system component IIB